MDVDLARWNDVLLSTLKRISKAHCVVFDLELSGIPERKRRAKQQTLQDRYAEVKEAAEKYHILQFGFTLVEEDVASSRYVLRSYNGNLTPLAEEVFELDRDFTYSSGAVQFLLNNNYKMESPFIWGVPYLKRNEDERARSNFLRRFDRCAIPDIKASDGGQEAVDMVKRLRSEITAWLESTETQELEYLFSNTPSTPADQLEECREMWPLSGFYRRLVHQTVRKEFPTLRTYAQSDLVMIAFRDEKRAAEMKEREERLFMQPLYRQYGFRFISDAFAGRDWHQNIDSGIINRRLEGESQTENTHLFKERMKELDQSLKDHQTVMIGHNCFLDLVYIYHNFYGELPDTVGEFQEALHKVFPLIIDTKFMSTVNRGWESRAQALAQLADALSTREKPIIDNPTDHPVYLDGESKFHEAGYDSYQTANVFLKLTASLEEEGEYMLDELSDGALDGTVTPPKDTNKPQSPPAASSSPVRTEVTAKKRKVKRRAAASDPKTKFSHSNVYSSLLDLDNPRPVDAVEETPTSTSRGGPRSKTAEQDLGKELNKLKISHRKANRKLIPPWSTNFWNVYGNKLRVNGTVEEMCDLTKNVEPRHNGEDTEKATSTEDSNKPASDGPAPSERKPWLDGFQSWLTGG